VCVIIIGGRNENEWLCMKDREIRMSRNQIIKERKRFGRSCIARLVGEGGEGGGGEDKRHKERMSEREKNYVCLCEL